MNTAESRELRGWVKLFQDGQSVKKIEDFTTALNNLQRAFSSLNVEMAAFNENAKKSNKFLARIAKLQESIDAQTKSANRITYLVILLAILQVIIALAPYVAKYILNWSI